MSSACMRRLRTELGDINKDRSSGISVPQLEDITDITHFRATFAGPGDTPYEGGEYIVDVDVPHDYPFKPPKMKFITKLWHPNVSSQTGAICLDTLGSKWTPVLTIKASLLSLQSLLSEPEPKDPQDAEVAKMMMSNPAQFEKVARSWAVEYARAPAETDWTKKQASQTPNTSSKPKPQLSREEKLRQEVIRYQGYHKDLIDRFVGMGFSVEQVVEAFNFVNIDRNGGEDYILEEAYIGDITARLFGEQ